MGLAVAITNGLSMLLVLFVLLPIILLTWFAVGTVLAMFFGPLGYILAFLMMVYYGRHF
jgi:hypothetical protein